MLPLIVASYASFVFFSLFSFLSPPPPPFVASHFSSCGKKERLAIGIPTVWRAAESQYIIQTLELVLEPESGTAAAGVQTPTDAAHDAVTVVLAADRDESKRHKVELPCFAFSVMPGRAVAREESFRSLPVFSDVRPCL